MKNKKCSPCQMMRYREFPSLLFGESEDGLMYFDATDYIKKNGDIKRHNTKEFEIGFFFWRKAVSNEMSIAFDDLIVQDETTRNILIEESLTLIFLSYIHPEFGIYLLQSMDEMLQEGFVISDSYLLHKTQQRISAEELMNLINNNEKKQI